MKIALNVGQVDRAMRIIAGCVLIGLAYSALFTGGAAMTIYAVGAVLILTGVIRYCPAYGLFGFKTGS